MHNRMMDPRREELLTSKIQIKYFFCLPLNIHIDTVETLYSTIYYSKSFIELNIDKSTQYVALWTHKRQPHTSPFRASYGVSFMSTSTEIYRVIKGFYCIPKHILKNPCTTVDQICPLWTISVTMNLHNHILRVLLDMNIWISWMIYYLRSFMIYIWIYISNRGVIYISKFGVNYKYISDYIRHQAINTTFSSFHLMMLSIALSDKFMCD